MDLSLLPRLQQLHAELEALACSPTSTSVLYAIRRELLRYYRQIPVFDQKTWPASFQRGFVHEQALLAAAVPFPAPSLEQQIAAVHQSLHMLRQTLQYPSNPLYAAARHARIGAQPASR
ncbi:hypothetical protein [Hymenobacter pini]|uniref:hypothetical protein n=1 Tax=Hymenobacter pini TaxID=2880879 RepID=UPI001CF4CCA2|nr:hypothetical protein [Hymenobacter pini]MCA8830495.1 hypothetical protein [Hymenobacter pini]